MVYDIDFELVRSLKERNQQAFNEIVQKYKDRIYRVVLSIVQNASEADDITQEVFLKVYYRIDTFQGKSSFFSWLYSIAINECRHCFRAKNRNTIALNTPLNDEDGANIGDLLKSGEESHDSKLIKEENISLAYDIINTLNPKYKTAYILRNVDGLSYKEIAEVLGISMDKVKVWLFRAREQIDERIKDLQITNDLGGI